MKTSETSSDVCDDELLVKATREGKVDSRGALGVRFDGFLNSDTKQKEVGFAVLWNVGGFPGEALPGSPRGASTGKALPGSSRGAFTGKALPGSPRGAFMWRATPARAGLARQVAGSGGCQAAAHC